MGAGQPRIRVPASLRRIFPSSSFVGCADIRVVEATSSSHDCRSGCLFAVIHGNQADGVDYVHEALERGASALLVDAPMTGVTVPQCVVPDVRKAYAVLCESLAGRPSQKLKIAGVTGTNGKTTTTWLIRSILNSAGHRAGLLGTIEYDDGQNIEPARLTTPDSKTASDWLAAMIQNGATHAAMELSSHALDQHRVSGVALDVAIVTNITQDHFDYHSGFADYRLCKARIIEQLNRGGKAVLNLDDAGSRSLAEFLAPETRVTYGLSPEADVVAHIVAESLQGSRFSITIGESQIDIATPLVGRHNVSNCLAAAAACHFMGISLDAIQRGIEQLASVPGRLERIAGEQPFEVFVDYAHTDDALRNCVHFLNRLCSGRVICVFGAGGDRDRSKRPLLGHAAAEADLAIITSDNPRSEHPDQIIHDILSGFSAGDRQPLIEPDRATAIGLAVEQAQPGDCVLVAGKGHETVQIIGEERIPFDDRAVVGGLLHRIDQPHSAAQGQHIYSPVRAPRSSTSF